jgi:hypothetical protein
MENLQPITASGGFKSISDDDLCAKCVHCIYAPGDLSQCLRDWPGLQDRDGYVRSCDQFLMIEADRN